VEGMMESMDRIPDKLLKEIFPRKLSRSLVSEKVYSDLKQMILSGKLKKGKRLVREEIAQALGVNETTVAKAFSQLKKDRLIIVKRRKGSFVVQPFKKSNREPIIGGEYTRRLEGRDKRMETNE
jgi:DNA-binding GntR family transcriptional regulator